VLWLVLYISRGLRTNPFSLLAYTVLKHSHLTVDWLSPWHVMSCCKFPHIHEEKICYIHSSVGSLVYNRRSVWWKIYVCVLLCLWIINLPVCCNFSQSASQVLHSFIFVNPSLNHTEFARFCQIQLRTGTASTLLYEFCTHLQII